MRTGIGVRGNGPVFVFGSRSRCSFRRAETAFLAFKIMPRAAHSEGPGPFLKWAGGKSQLLSHILPRFPERLRTYYEPFIGGGAVFFALAKTCRFERAVLGDLNPALVEVYTVVRDEVSALEEALGVLAVGASDPDFYYDVRGWDPQTLDPVKRTARFLFLNKTCFNGLYRVNRKGRFNVPFGRHKNPRVLNAPRLRAASRVLQGVTIVHSDFDRLVQHVRRGDGVYFDPPYVPVSATSSFTAYAAHPFTYRDHERLAETYRQLIRRGVTAVLSNSDCAFTRALYEDLEVECVQASRAINSVASRRGTISELLVVGMPEQSDVGLRPATEVVTSGIAPVRSA